METWTARAMHDPAARFYIDALQKLSDTGIPFLIGGAIAFSHYANVPRETKDIDIFVKPQDCPRVRIGSVTINHPARPNEDLKRLQDKGVAVFAIREDLEERGINLSSCLSGVNLIRRNDIALLLDDYDQVWHW